jgi:hypothetical protein
MCGDSLVCDIWKKEFCGGQTSNSLLEVGQEADADDWITKSLGGNHSIASFTEHMAMAFSKRANTADDHDMLTSKTKAEVHADVDSFSGLDAAVKGKCVA